MAKKFSELRAKMSPEAQARAAARAEAVLVEMQLQDSSFDSLFRSTSPSAA